MNFTDIMAKIRASCLGIFGIYLLWICLHYIAPHLYVRFCVPATIIGFIMSPFIATSPHCQAIRWTIHNGGNTITAMWILMGTWIIQHFIPNPLKNG